MKRIIKMIILFGFLIGLMNCQYFSGVTYVTNPQIDGQTLQILYTKQIGGKYDVYTNNLEGTNEKKLTNTGSLDGVYASSSPDGTKIVYNYGEILIINWEGILQNKALSGAVVASEVTWSPDGTKIAFRAQYGSWDAEICIVNSNGTGSPTGLTSDGASYSGQPCWSPDGTKIAFVSNRDGDNEIFIMNSDGSNQTNLTNNSFYDVYPTFSPDGKKILFHSTRTTNTEIYTMNIDGSDVRRLTYTHGGLDSHSASWSPDGSKIIFASNRAGLGIQEPYLMNADGTGIQKLFNCSISIINPSFRGKPR